VHGVVEPQALGGDIDKAHSSEHVQGAVCSLAEHGFEHTTTDSPRNRCGIEDVPRLGVESGAKRCGERVDDLGFAVVRRHLGCAGLGGESDGKRVPARDPDDRLGRCGLLDPS